MNTTEGFEELSNNTNIDVVFYGSSHAYTSINPLIINNSCNTISYNLGSSALRLLFTELVIEESIRYNKPELMVIEVHSNSIKIPIRKEIKYFQYYALDFIPNYVLSKIDKTRKVYKKSEFLSVFSPLIRNHTKWNMQDFFSLDRKENLDLSNHYYAGFRGAIRSVKKEQTEKYKNFQIEEIKVDTLKEKMTKLEEIEVDKIIAIAKKEDIQILFFSAPTIKSRFENYNFFYELNQYFENRGVKYINTNDYIAKIGLELKDFRDLDHLNTSGSNKVSEFLATYINNEFSLSDRSSDEIWKKNLESLKEFELLVKNND